MKYISQEEANAAIYDKIMEVKGDYNGMVEESPIINDTKLRMYVEKFVVDVMDYCHREDFPDSLIYTAVELITKWTDAETSGEKAPLKSLKQNDTEFTFAVSDVSSTGNSHEADFESLKPKLNRFRKVGGRQPWNS